MHEDPQGLVVLTPPPVKVQVIDVERPLQAGSHLRFRVGLGPISVPVRVIYEEFTPYQPGMQSCGFVDRMINGPFRMWRHQHRFEDRGDGSTACIDDLSFALPGRFLGDLLSWIFIWPGIAFMFISRRFKTRRLLDQGWHPA
jgi:ligand-binding SRPBCC domain-containing protein